MHPAVPSRALLPSPRRCRRCLIPPCLLWPIAERRRCPNRPKSEILVGGQGVHMLHTNDSTPRSCSPPAVRCTLFVAEALGAAAAAAYTSISPIFAASPAPPTPVRVGAASAGPKIHEHHTTKQGLYSGGDKEALVDGINNLLKIAVALVKEKKKKPDNSIMPKDTGDDGTN